LFLTPEGWKRLAELREGDRVLANGVPALQNKEWLERVYLHENNTLREVADLAGCCVTYVTKALRRHGINKPLSMRKNRKPGHGVPGMHSKEARRQISERMTGNGNHRWKGEHIGPSGGRTRARKLFVAGQCWGCGYESVERHHIDGDPTNNDASNVKLLCTKCHKAFHLGGGVLAVFSDEIVKIAPVGQSQTFDLEMESEPHNFVANGLVVHNSQESTRYCNYLKKGVTFCIPPWINVEEGEYRYIDLPDGDTPNQRRWLSTLLHCEQAYNAMIKDGWQPQMARDVLPTTLKTEIVSTMNCREWRHVFRLRTFEKAHPRMRELMIPLLAEFKTLIPVLFDDIEASPLEDKWYAKARKPSRKPEAETAGGLETEQVERARWVNSKPWSLPPNFKCVWHCFVQAHPLDDYFRCLFCGVRDVDVESTS
jgi:thymidylate synthase (FAD)